MGFSDLAAQIILIFIFLVIFVSMFVAYRDYVNSASQNLDYVYEELSNRIQTDLEVVYTNYTAGNIKLTLINTGSTTLDYHLIDIFVNGDKINRSTVAYTIFNQTNDFLYWNPTEALNISFSKTLTSRSLVQVSSQYGISTYTQIMP